TKPQRNFKRNLSLKQADPLSHYPVKGELLDLRLPSLHYPSYPPLKHYRNPLSAHSKLCNQCTLPWSDRKTNRRAHYLFSCCSLQKNRPGRRRRHHSTASSRQTGLPCNPECRSDCFSSFAQSLSGL